MAEFSCKYKVFLICGGLNNRKEKGVLEAMIPLKHN